MTLFIFETVAIKPVLRLNILHEMFYNSQFKKYNCNSHSYNRKILVDVPSYIIFAWKE